MCQFNSIKKFSNKKKAEVKEIKHINLCKLNEQNKLTVKKLLAGLSLFRYFQ
jgi:hypothetical protein